MNWKNRDMKTTILLIILLTNSCGLFENNQENDLTFVDVFSFNLNGEAFFGEPRAVTTTTDQFDQLVFSGVRLDSTKVPYGPYLQRLVIGAILEDGRRQYPIIRSFQQEPPYLAEGGFISERDGDAPIAQYNPIDSELNRLVIQKADSEFGPYIFGEFETIAVVEENVSEFGHRNRRLPDTLHITNGRFRILLEQEGD